MINMKLILKLMLNITLYDHTCIPSALCVAAYSSRYWYVRTSSPNLSSCCDYKDASRGHTVCTSDNTTWIRFFSRHLVVSIHIP